LESGSSERLDGGKNEDDPCRTSGPEGNGGHDESDDNEISANGEPSHGHEVLKPHGALGHSLQDSGIGGNVHCRGDPEANGSERGDDRGKFLTCNGVS